MPLPRNEKLKERSRDLRKNMTPQERHLWYDFLSKYPIRFQRQRPIGNYIVDFYCHRGRLAVEVDGSQHFEPENVRADNERTAFLNRQGIIVLRYANNQVNREFRGVCEDIDRIVRERIKEEF